MKKTDLVPQIKVTKSPFPRGKLIKLTMEIEYPDGEMKTVEYTGDWLEKTGAILLDESCMSEAQLQKFWGTEDWENDNPTCIRWLKSDSLNEKEVLRASPHDNEVFHGCCYKSKHR